LTDKDRKRHKANEQAPQLRDGRINIKSDYI